MKRLNSYLEDLQKKNPVNPTHLMFYLKNGSEQEEGKPNSVHIACKQALRIGYSAICFQIARGAPPSYLKANLGISNTESRLQATSN